MNKASLHRQLHVGSFFGELKSFRGIDLISRNRNLRPEADYFHRKTTTFTNQAIFSTNNQRGVSSPSLIRDRRKSTFQFPSIIPRNQLRRIERIEENGFFTQI